MSALTWANWSPARPTSAPSRPRRAGSCPSSCASSLRPTRTCAPWCRGQHHVARPPAARRQSRRGDRPPPGRRSRAGRRTAVRRGPRPGRHRSTTHSVSTTSCPLTELAGHPLLLAPAARRCAGRSTEQLRMPASSSPRWPRSTGSGCSPRSPSRASARRSSRRRLSPCRSRTASAGSGCPNSPGGWSAGRIGAARRPPPRCAPCSSCSDQLDRARGGPDQPGVHVGSVSPLLAGLGTARPRLVAGCRPGSVPRRWSRPVGLRQDGARGRAVEVGELDGRARSCCSRSTPQIRQGALSSIASETIAAAADSAGEQGLPLVATIGSSGADILEGIAALARVGARRPGARPVLRTGPDDLHRRRSGGLRARRCCSVSPTT